MGCAAWAVRFAIAICGLVGLGVLSQMASAPTGIVVTAVVGLCAGDLVLLWWVARSGSHDGSAVDRHLVLLALCWVTTAMFGMHNIEHRPTSDVVSELTVQTGVELLLFGLVGAVAVVLLTQGTPVVALGASLFVFPVWIIASATWSDAPIYAVGRGLEFVVLVALATATASYCMIHPGAVHTLIWTVLRWIVLVTAGLVVAGVAFGPIFVLAMESNLERFTWIGAHPGDSGFLLGVALLIVVSSPRERLRMNAGWKLVFVAMFVTGLYANETRTALAGFAVAGIFLLAVQLRRNPATTAVALPLLIGGGVLSAGALGGYILRDGDVSKLWTLNGRTELWQVAYDRLDTLGRWTIGLGYGMSRVVFIDQFSFASNAHNSLLGAIVDLGVIGAAILLTLTFSQFPAAARARLVEQTDFGVTMVAVLLFVIVSGATSDHLIMPSFASVYVYFFAAITSAVAAQRLLQPSPEADRVASSLERSSSRAADA